MVSFRVKVWVSYIIVFLSNGIFHYQGRASFLKLKSIWDKKGKSSQGLEGGS